MAPPGKKHLLLHVPDHKPLPGTGALPGTTAVYSTFLRLGTPDANPPMKELLESIVTGGFVDDTRPRGPNEVLANQPAVDGAPAIAGPGHTLTPAERQAETARFLSKGGWHDHTQGNRISTTQGDKIEVVRGNYRMLVLGRQDDLESSHDLDSSGGLKMEGDIAPGSVSEIRWVVDPYSGTWRVAEKTEKGDVHQIFHGNSKEERYGLVVESITGSETEPDLPESELTPKVKKTNPAITERTWASSINTYTGSAAKYVPLINELTYATTIKEETHATNIESRTKGEVYIKDYVGELATPVKEIDEETHVDHMKSLTVAGTHKELEFVGVKTGLVIAGIMTDIEVSVLRLEVKAGGGFLEIEAGGFYMEVFMGIKGEYSLAKKLQILDSDYRTALRAQNIAVTDNAVVVKLKKLAASFSAITLKASIGLGAD